MGAGWRLDRASVSVALAALLALLAYLPLPMARRLSQGVMWSLNRCVPRLRRIGHRNLELAFPELAAAERDRLVDEVYGSLARTLLAFAKFPRLHSQNIHEWIRYEGYEHYEDAKRRGKGVLFATAHLGNWELSAFAHALMSEPMHVVVRPLDNERVDRLVERRRALSGNHIIGKREGARAILRALQANEAVGILVDQNVLRDEGVFVDFFGQPACTQAVFAKLAARSGAAVLPGYALWSETEQRHVLKFDAPLPMTGDAVRDTQTIQTHLEQVIRRYPGQWLWLHRRWKTRPEGEAAVY